MGGKRGKTVMHEAREGEQVVKAMTGSDFSLEQFRRAARSGAFWRVVLVADWTRFRVRGDLAGGCCAYLAKTRSEGWRTFGNPAAALALLRKMGVVRVEVEMGEWDVEMASLAMRMRPDVTARRLQRKRTAYMDLLAGGLKRDMGIEAAPPNRKEELNRLMEANAKRKVDEARIAEADERWRSGEGKKTG